MNLSRFEVIAVVVLLATLNASCGEQGESDGVNVIPLRNFDEAIDCVDPSRWSLAKEQERPDLIAHFLADAEHSGFKVQYNRAVPSTDPEHVLYIYSSRKYTDIYVAYAVDKGEIESASKFHFGSLGHRQFNKGCAGVPGNDEWDF